MNEIKITVDNNGKKKSQSFNAVATFTYRWNSLLRHGGYGGDFSMTAFGATKKEARESLHEELFRFQSEFVKALSILGN